MREHRFKLLAFILIAFLPLLLASAQPPGKDGKAEKSAAKPKQQFARQTDPSLYAGSDTCQGCHEDIFKSHQAGPHRKSDFNDKGVGWQGCESCHGPGQAHVEAGGDKSLIFTFNGATAREASQRCMDCHGQNQEHAGFSRSKHLRADVGCTTCHSAHKPKLEQALLTQPATQLCFSCHTDVKTEFARPFKHRVNEGLVTCNDCHNPHGGNQPRHVRASRSADATCFTCHADKQGPFVFEHAPVKAEGCSSCHTPHGSTNQRLLKRSAVNQLCLECHTPSISGSALAPRTAGPAHNQNARYQACTVCHTFVHGSNSSEVFFKP